MKRKKQNGMAIVAVLIINFILGAFILGLLSYTTVLKQREQDKINTERAMFLAQRGIAYAYTEMRLHGYSWFTHKVVGQTNKLVPIAATPNVILPSADIGPKGCYRPFGDDSVLVKIYSDKDGNIWMKAQGKSKDKTFILISGVGVSSLYDYFLFIPDENPYIHGKYDGEGIGKIYISGNVKLSASSKFYDVPEIKLSSKGSFLQYSGYYSPHTAIAEKKSIGSGLDGYGEEFMPRLDPKTKHTYSDENPLPWGERKYDFSRNWPPYQFRPPDCLFYATSGKSAHIEFSDEHADLIGYISKTSIDIPAYFEGYEWKWDGINGDVATETKKGTILTSPTGDIANMDYWDEIKQRNKSLLNARIPADEEDLLPPYMKKVTVKDAKGKEVETYEFYVPKGKEEVDVDFLNSYHQEDAWDNFLSKYGTSSTKGLKNILKDGHNGGEDLAPLEINTAIKEEAQTTGIYAAIKLVLGKEGPLSRDYIFSLSEAGTKYECKINESEGKLEGAPDKCPNWIKETFKPKKDMFVNYYLCLDEDYKVNKEDLMEMDISKLKEHIDKNSPTGMENVVFFDFGENAVEVEKTETFNKVPKIFASRWEKIFKAKAASFFSGGIILEKGEELPEGGLTLVTPQNIYVHGDYNLHTEGEDKWQPASLITDSNIVVLSDNFEFPDRMPMGWTPPNYPYELGALVKDGDIKTLDFSTYTDQDWTKLENKCKELFALPSSFSLSPLRDGSEPAAQAYLLKEIRTAYYNYYKDMGAEYHIPNTIGDDTVEINTAMVSPAGYKPRYLEMGYELEKDNPWHVSDSAVDPNYKACKGKFDINGAFIKLKKHWSNDYDKRWSTSFYRYNFYISALDKKSVYKAGVPSSLWDSQLCLHYEKKYGTTMRPPGDFSAGTYNLWMPIKDFDHHGFN